MQITSERRTCPVPTRVGWCDIELHTRYGSRLEKVVSRRRRSDRHMRADGTALAATLFWADTRRVFSFLVVVSAERLAVGDRVRCPKCRRWHPAIQSSSGSISDRAKLVLYVKCHRSLFYVG